MTTIGTICARGNSQELPRKNILLLDGKPLIVHSIEHALKCESIDVVYCSTDSPEIAEIATRAGAIVPYIRPAQLAQARTSKIEVLEHLVEYLESLGETVSRIVDLQPTSPLRHANDITACLMLLDDECDCTTTATLSGSNPYYNLIELDDTGMAVLSKSGNYVARQQAPDVWRLTGSVYCWHRTSLHKGVLGGRTKTHPVPAERSIDIDTAFDLRLTEFMIKDSER